jgi:hypothetical protein
VELKSTPAPGTAVPVTAYLADRTEPLKLLHGLVVTGPLPVIVSSRLSLPEGMAIKVRSDEFPAGYTLNALLDVKNIERQSVLRLACADGAGGQTDLHIGEQTTDRNLQQLSPDQLFLAITTGAIPSGCSLNAVIDNGRDGRSQPVTLAHIIRAPQIDSFTLMDTAPSNGNHEFQLTGQNLEMIGQVGWDKGTGLAISGLPAPLPGPGMTQSIHVNLPDPPAPESPLYIWLRGDTEGRQTIIKAPALEPAKPQPTMTTITSSANPSFVGQPVTFDAKVDDTAVTGKLAFMDGLTVLGETPLNGGSATYTAASLAAGSHTITAVYSGDANHAGSTSSAITQTVTKQSTQTTISATPNPAAAGQDVLLTAIVAVTPPGAGDLDGVVTFYSGDAILGTANLDAKGTATFDASTLPHGDYKIKAVYTGSAAFAESTSTSITQVIQ